MNEDEDECTPPEISEKAAQVALNLLPSSSKESYLKNYRKNMSSTMWSQYSYYVEKYDKC